PAHVDEVLGARAVEGPLRRDAILEQVTEVVRVHAVDRGLEALAEELVVDAAGGVLEREQTFTPGAVGEADDRLDRDVEPGTLEREGCGQRLPRPDDVPHRRGR